jgi:hypothetical protein
MVWSGRYPCIWSAVFSALSASVCSPRPEFTLNTTGNGLFFGGGAGFLMAQLPTNSWIKLFSLQLGCSWLGTLKTVFKLDEDAR